MVFHTIFESEISFTTLEVCSQFKTNKWLTVKGDNISETVMSI